MHASSHENKFMHTNFAKKWKKGQIYYRLTLK